MYSLIPDYQAIMFIQKAYYTHILYTQYTPIYIIFGAILVLKIWCFRFFFLSLHRQL